MKQDLADSARLVWYSLLVFVIFGFAIVGGVFLWWHMLPVVVERERDVVKSSRQYIESKQSELLLLAKDYEATTADIARYSVDPVKYKDVIAGLETQRDAIFDKMKVEAELISGSVPRSVRAILAKGN